jgi:hypothetical protein
MKEFEKPRIELFNGEENPQSSQVIIILMLGGRVSL